MSSGWLTLARQVGFTQVSVSHQVSPLMKLVSRGDTTVVDAYLSPILRRYVDRIAAALQAGDPPGDRRQGAQGLAKTGRANPQTTPHSKFKIQNSTLGLG
jgi:5-oxoprolinase (ATP-hydrolysing)